VPESFAEATRYYRNGDLTRVIIAKLGTRAVASITGQVIVHMLVETHRTWTVSKHVLTPASKLFDHAAGLRQISINPCAGVSLVSLFGPRPPIKKRIMLSADELRIVLAALDTLGTTNALAFRILLATCVRTNELVSARWENIDLEKGSWFVPDATTNTRTGFRVPLTPPVVAWFRELLALSGTSAFVLPARIRRGGDMPVVTRTLWAAITRAFDTGRLTVSKFTPHDARSTAKGHMLNLGTREHVAELALSHVVKGRSGIYDVREEIPEKREAIQVWADFLLTLTAPAPAPIPQEPASKPRRSKPPPQPVA
jgi:integrase